MYVVKNNGRFPVIIRDLNYHIEGGGKAVDLDLVFRREMTEKSVDLKNLFRCKKLILLNKSEVEIQKPLPPQIKKEPDVVETTDPKSNELLALLLKKFGDLESAIHNGGGVSVNNSEPQYNDSTMEKLAELKANSLANKEDEVERNFSDIGKTTEQKDNSLNDMLNILNNLDKGE